MITKRDIEILRFLNRYGKTYIEVLAKTFFKNEQVARNRINKLYKDGLVGYWNTGLMKPRRAIVLTKESKEYLYNELGINPKKAKINKTTIEHNLIEQIVDFYLQKLGTVERTTVYKHHGKLNHIPDLFYTSNSGKKFFVEVELSKKSNYRYKEIVFQMNKDNIDGVIYISDTIQKAKAIAKIMPTWNKLYYIDIDSFIQNIEANEKIKPFKQSILIES